MEEEDEEWDKKIILNAIVNFKHFQEEIK